MWLIIYFFMVAGASAQIVSQAGDKCSRHYVCPPQFLRLSQNCYFFSKYKTTWQDAFFACQDLHVSEERWIGGMYDWEQMIWKWGASGREVKYKGFSRMDPEDKEKLKWHCIVLDPTLQYKWNTRSCLEEKYFICQTKLKKVARKERKKLQQQYRVDKYNKLNEVPVPGIPDYQQNTTNLKEHKPNGIMHHNNSLIETNAFATRNDTVIEKRKGRRKHRSSRKSRRKLCEPHIIRNGTEYNTPQLKYGKRRRRNKSKESKEEKDASIENIQTQIYYSGSPKSPLYPRIITEELSFH